MHSQKDLKALSQKIGNLPTLPGVAIKILEAMRRETPNIAEISKVISADAPLSAKVLKIVNSPFYGLSNKITSVHQAIVYLGLNTVKNLALSFSLLSVVPRPRAEIYQKVTWLTSGNRLRLKRQPERGDRIIIGALRPLLSVVRELAFYHW